ncbi:MAG: DNA-directed RNA polymerase subunit beta', partial [Oscillospiraceae bacterium]
VPLSAEAQAEARFLMLAANNILKPSDGRPVAVPTQDMVLGSYYLTLCKDGDKGEGKIFRDSSEAMMAYDEGIITLHAKIKVRMTKTVGDKTISKIIDTTMGRIIFNQNIPQDLGYVDRTNRDNEFLLEIDFLVKKKQLGDIVDRCIRTHGTARTADVLDQIKSLGFKFSTKGAVTVAVCDAVIPPQKKELLAEAESTIEEITDQFNMGLISNEERLKHVLETWSQTTDKVTKALQDNLDQYNPIFMMADSGARGSINQIRQLAGMRGLIANTSGTTIEVPIRANYREGLNILEYFISSRGARKGLADTALRTADSGYLTRRLVDVSQDVIIRQDDCKTHNGIEVYSITEGKELIEPMEERLLGRYLVDDAVDPKTGEVIVTTDKLIDVADAKKIIAAGIEKITIRSMLTCECKQGVCTKCYGANLASGKPVAIGEAVGVIAAQSIGEPGTQLTMRTFHTGGIANAEDITQGLPRVEELFEGRKPKNAAILTEITGKVRMEDIKRTHNIIVTSEDGDEKIYPIPYGFRMKVREGDTVTKGDSLTEGSINPHDILAILGDQEVQNYLIAEVQKAYRVQGVDINDKHIEVIVRQMLRKVRLNEAGSTDLLPGVLCDRAEVRYQNRNIQKRIDAGEKDLHLGEYTSVLLGITKASLATDSFLSAASFQETTRVLTEAAIKGKVDPLLGLKENVIIGKLIPAGTGMKCYTDVGIVQTRQPVETVSETEYLEEDEELPEEIRQ